MTELINNPGSEKSNWQRVKSSNKCTAEGSLIRDLWNQSIIKGKEATQRQEVTKISSHEERIYKIKEDKT